MEHFQLGLITILTTLVPGECTPEGPLYLALQCSDTAYTLDVYQAIVRSLVNRGCVTQAHDTLRLTALGETTATRVREAMSAG